MLPMPFPVDRYSYYNNARMHRMPRVFDIYVLPNRDWSVTGDMVPDAHNCSCFMMMKLAGYDYVLRGSVRVIDGGVG